MGKKSAQSTRYYQTYEDDFAETADQDLTLPASYQWIHKSKGYQLYSKMIFGLGWLFSWIYCRLFLHTHVKNKKVLRRAKGKGIFLYGNHTQEIGDAFLPVQACPSRRIYVVVSPSNLGIPVIGKILPALGALPIPDNISQMREFVQAISQRIQEHAAVVIYPEAHVWQYCNFIRPFSDHAFQYPVQFNAPVYAMTTTYQKRRFSKKPKITIYVDGPFTADPTLSRKAQQKQLRDAVYQCMKNRSQNSTYAYISYEKGEI